MLLRFAGGARGVLVASQVNTGLENGCACASRARWARWSGGRKSRTADALSPRRAAAAADARRALAASGAQRAGRIPPGHPEGFIEAFANVYLGVAAAIRAHGQRPAPDPLEADYPDVEDGARGVRFIEKVVESAGSQAKWTPMR
jgi:hypothetical protein